MSVRRSAQMGVRLNKNVYSTIDLSVRRSAQMGIKMKKSIGLICLKLKFLFGICCLLSGIYAAGMTVCAEEMPFTIQADIIPGADSEIFDIQVTVSNAGEDFDGIVRLLVGEEYASFDAYDTLISLPCGSTKQFIVKVRASDEYGELTYIQILDKKQRVKAEREYVNFFSDNINGIYLGILSDNYPALTFLDLGGERFFFYGDHLPIKLAEVSGDSLKDILQSLTILVIDQYDSSVLDQDTITAIEQWVDNGGVLIIGTGAHGEKTLGGFDKDFADIQVTGVKAPDNNRLPSPDIYVNTSMLSMADLYVTDYSYAENYYVGGYSTSKGNGSVTVFPYSLAELGALSEDSYEEGNSEYFINNILDTACSMANSRYTNNTSDNYSIMNRTMERFFGVLDSNNNYLHFGILKFFIFLYVIFAGPVLYLILRALKKQEFYWAAVPVLSFLMIFFVYLAGRGFEVTSTRVSSVSVADASGWKDIKTYLLCYDTGHREWSVKLDDVYYNAVPAMEWNNYDADMNYYYHITKEGETLSIGIKPSANFENSYFLAKRDNPETGSITASGITELWGSFSGSVTNNTGKDFLYFAIIADDTIVVYDRLSAGETCDLQNRVPINDVQNNYSYGNVYTNYLNHCVGKAYEQQSNEDPGVLSALGIGIASAYEEGDILIIGVTENYLKAVNDTCSEKSYGCLYTKYTD